MSDAKEILEAIIGEFSPEKFILFFRRKNPKFRESKEKYDRYDNEDFQKGLKLGELEFDDGDNLLITTFEVQKPLSERSGKKAQYEKAKAILKSEENRIYSAGIFIFYDDKGCFRFSLVYPESIGTKRQWNNFRRFTYYVGSEQTNKTFKKRIGDGDFSTLRRIKDSFAVEPVTNHFFDEFRVYFEKTKTEFEKSNKNTIGNWLKDKYSEEEQKEQINKFTFTFLGRIIFIYFLQRKKWIENDENYIKKFIEDPKNTNLYFSFFQPLFFEVFAKKEANRPPKTQEQYKNTPYLNGGLFERSELESQQQGHFILFEDVFIRDIILNFFENYNFTIDENSPEDQEVSIDPEMLGKVFENTLAEEERGKKGTFYTPREIVHFMVKDSLFRFLLNETELDSSQLHEFIYGIKSLEELKFTKEEVRLIDSKLEHIKVLDPAVGSAAFPVEMMQILVDLRKKLNVNVGRNINEVTLKKRFIKENLYGVDIDPGAIEIAKLRLWLSLIVDYEKSEAEPLPNLDFQFRLGNSLQEKIDDIDIFSAVIEEDRNLFTNESEVEAVKDQMIAIKDTFYGSDDEVQKRKLQNDFDEHEHRLIQMVLDDYKIQIKEQMGDSGTLLDEHKRAKTIKIIQKILVKIKGVEQKIKDGTYKLFKPDFHFSEVFDRKDENDKKIGGFDIVIGNPPYGVKVEDNIKETHELGSKDSYGVFISTALKRFLKPGGVLSYIVSDTWLTIKSHKKLREQVLASQLHKIIRVHQDCFEATVNACILILTYSPSKNGNMIAADFTNISTRNEVEELRSKLYNLKKYIGQSTPKFAVYDYNQDLIKTNSNLPIFVGSPKLFRLMNDTTCPTIEKEIDGKTARIRQMQFNDNNFELVRLGDVSDVRVGLQTGDNRAYLFQNPQARGSYRSIEEYKNQLLTFNDLRKITENDLLRSKVINMGFHKSKNEQCFDEDLWFEGRYIAPYDKGGESDTDIGWLPNYYVTTNYFIDWSQDAVQKMQQSTSARFQNKEYYFKSGITFSWAGVYCPTFRESSILFDHGSSDIFINTCSINQILALLCSKIIKMCSRIFINHSINFGIDDVKDIPINLISNDEVVQLVIKICEKQKQNHRYDYMSNEQKEIDKIVYDMYGLNKDDIREIETWYARRYPKLASFCDLDQTEKTSAESS